MSTIATLNENVVKSWINPRVNNLTVDGTANIPNISSSNLTLTGNLIVDGTTSLVGTSTISGDATIRANEYFQHGPTGTDYRVISMDGGNSLGFLFANYQALGDGIALSYNFYYPTGSVTPTMPSVGAGTSMIQMTYNQILMMTGVNGASPTSKLVIHDTGEIEAQNGGYYTTQVGINFGSSTLNTYEEFSATGTWGDVWAAPVAGTIYAVHVGKSVTVSVSVLGTPTVATGSARAVFNVPIPLRLCPKVTTTTLFTGLIAVIDNASDIVGNWALEASTGVLSIGTTYDPTGVFSGLHTIGGTGWYNFNFSYYSA